MENRIESFENALKKQITLDLAERALTTSLTYPVLFLIYVKFSSVYEDSPTLSLYIGLLLLIIAVTRFTLTKKVDYFRKHSTINFYLTFNILTLFAALTWSLSGCYFCFKYGLSHQSYLHIFIATGICAGASTTLSTDLKLVNLFIFIIMSPYCMWGLLYEPDKTSAFAICILFYLLFMTMVNIKQNKWYIDNFTANYRLKAQAEELEKAKEASEASAKAKSRFLANMSHEIRTPMNGVTGMLDILTETDLTQDQADLTESAKASADSLLNLINDILDFSKIEESKLELNIVDFNLRDVLESLCDVMALETEKKGVEFSLLIESDVPVFLRGAPDRIRQIAANLCGNAVKFTALGEVFFSVSLLEFNSNTATLLFKVKDTGIGIPEDKQMMLFQSFSQIDASITREFGGTGLGLTISKQLAELMGGEIGFESTENVGSTFWFTLQLEKQQSEKSFHTDKYKGLSVLIAAFKPRTVRIIREYLNYLGIQYFIASDLINAIETLKNTAPDNAISLVFTGDNCSQVEVESFTKEVFALYSEKTPEVVFTMPFTRATNSAWMEKNRVSDTLLTPVKFSQLELCLETLLNEDIRGEQNTVPSIIANDKGTFKLKILLAEDNKMNQKVAVRMLTTLGHHVDVAENGLEAVKEFEEKNFDLILMDGQMPKMSGLEATKKIRAIEKSNFGRQKSIPIVAITANAMKGDRERFLAAGMDDFLTKPLKKEALNSVLETLSGNTRL